MKIYFTCSTAEFGKYKQNYYAIRDLLIVQNHVLTRDWLKLTQERIDNNQIELEDVKTIYKECMQAINESELVIIEDTVSNFSTGHQITVALQRQKPTLVLWQGKKHRHFKKMFIHGVDSDLLEVAEYNLDNLSEILTRFINKYEHANQKNRFHLVLNNVERNYLDWAQYNKGKSRTNLIREQIQKALSEDEDYQKYLASK
jgi:hypothetical protein